MRKGGPLSRVGKHPRSRLPGEWSPCARLGAGVNADKGQSARVAEALPGQKVLFQGPRRLGAERWPDGAGGDSACAIGHVLGHLKGIGKAGARDRAAGLGGLLLLGDGAVRVEADGAVLCVGGAGDRDGRGADPGVGPEELVRVARAWTTIRAAYLWWTMRGLSAWRALTRVESAAEAALRASIRAVRMVCGGAAFMPVESLFCARVALCCT
jgi:hypothetical protein